MAMVTGRTEQGQEIRRQEEAANAPFLKASFWQAGTKIRGEVLSFHKSDNGNYLAVRLEAPEFVEVYDNAGDLQQHSVVRLGNLAGVNDARKACLRKYKKPYLVVGDVFELECTGITPAEKEGYSDSPRFEMGVELETPARKAQELAK
jgi:hypothetical protein